MLDLPVQQIVGASRYELIYSFFVQYCKVNATFGCQNCAFGGRLALLRQCQWRTWERGERIANLFPQDARIAQFKEFTPSLLPIPLQSSVDRPQVTIRVGKGGSV